MARQMSLGVAAEGSRDYTSALREGDNLGQEFYFLSDVIVIKIIAI